MSGKQDTIKTTKTKQDKGRRKSDYSPRPRPATGIKK